MTKTLALRLLLVIATILSASGCGPSSADESSADPSPAPTAHVLVHLPDPTPGFDVIVGHRYHVSEGATEQAYAMRLLVARGVGDRGAIEEMYARPEYEHFGGSNEDARPLCRIVEQDDTTVDDSALNEGGSTSPIHCTMADGSDFYATGLMP